ncbi:MAG TPA: methyltransferase domain-containing protein [Spirochaetota bacterium]|nr:methyltransferase domain-containing protein [Spirochaetota bacterium]
MSTEARRVKADYFHELAPGWDEKVGNNAGRKEKLRRVFDMIEIRKGARVLDVGCGSGVLFRFIEEKTGPDGTILAVDPAEGMIDRAKELHRDFDNIQYSVGFIEDSGLPHGEFDVALCYAVLPHIEDIPRSLKVLYRALVSGGRVYIFHPDDTRALNEFHAALNGPIQKDVLPAEDELRVLLADAGFRVLSYIDEPGLNFVECEK